MFFIRKKGKIMYFDYGATTPMSKRALEAYQMVAVRFYGNTSSLHEAGVETSRLLEASRKKFASFLHAQEDGLYFTSGGSESNRLAIRSIAYGQKDRGNHIITSCCEHHSVLETCKQLEKEGFSVTYLPVDSNGRLNVETIRNALREDTILVSLAYGNGDIGTMHPIPQIGQLLHEKKVIFHCDCVQAFSKVDIDVTRDCMDSLSISSHKVYGPKGVGACYIAPHIHLVSQHPGATHEKGFRMGTVDTPGIVSFITACEELFASDAYKNHLQEMRTYFLNKLKALPFTHTIEGDKENSLPHVIGLRFHGVEGQWLMMEASRQGLYFSTGSACHVHLHEPTPTMTALGRTNEEAFEFIRFTLGKHTTKTEIDQAIQLLKEQLVRFFKE